MILHFEMIHTIAYFKSAVHLPAVSDSIEFFVSILYVVSWLEVFSYGRRVSGKMLLRGLVW